METLNNQPPSMDWQIYRNDNTAMTLVLVNSEDKKLDLTDWTFTGQVREFATDTEVIQAFDIIKNENVLTIGLDATNLKVMNYFDIQGINTVTETVSTILTGTIYVQEDVTR